MTTIDSAIIKALVEHIGLNPDDVTTGGTSTSSIIPVTWSFRKIESNRYALAFTLPEGYKIKLGTCLKLKGIEYGNWTKSTVLYCKNVSSDGTELTFRNAKITMVKFTLQDGLYVSNENCMLEEHIDELPNNETTGLFSYNTLETIEGTIEWIFWKIRYLNARIDELREQFT